ncbi:hypothetical protein [Parvularcula sp. LCG005]|uniref:hypothetical protein n=1 Tax=Parvularcula sp. LCG005 TaxID=3078805 RepID=UPI002941F762|nr:hypothetical protein [Parvularcula sp. LCG005]WOI52481.1 hypothetical protein RUI03_10015 [Parvularcula sp. LCG005]
MFRNAPFFLSATSLALVGVAFLMIAAATLTSASVDRTATSIGGEGPWVIVSGSQG